MKKTEPAVSGGLVHNPFAVLMGPANVDTQAQAEPDPTKHVVSLPKRAVVRLERKGRAGKEVTVIEGTELTVDELLLWLRDLKQTVGCGGTLEGERMVLQGDQRTRVRAYLAGRGVRRVT